MDAGDRGCNPIPRIRRSRAFSSFPRKREPKDFSYLPLGPRLRGDDEFIGPQDSESTTAAHGDLAADLPPVLEARLFRSTNEAAPPDGRRSAFGQLFRWWPTAPCPDRRR